VESKTCCYIAAALQSTIIVQEEIGTPYLEAEKKVVELLPPL
jgi:hypothetical protein